MASGQTPHVEPRENQLVGAINLARAGAGLSPLVLQPELTAAAARYARVLSRADRLGHAGIDGSTLRQRIDASGYRYRGFNENLSAGYPTADLVVQGWMRSPGHRKNLLDPNMRDLGVGYAGGKPGGRYGHFWVMVGGSPSWNP